MVRKLLVVVRIGMDISMGVAQRFMREGYHVAMLARNSDKLREL